VHSAAVLAIGEFSRLTHLSVRTLRRYHDAGLLEPATVDPDSGYRYYTADQIPTAQVIHRLRELAVPLPDVQRILRSSDPGTRAALVADHLQRLESELDEAVELAVTTHVGGHDDIDVTYGELGAWVVRNALHVDGPVRETYLRLGRGPGRVAPPGHRSIRSAGLSRRLRTRSFGRLA
jgi:DNA-binding transcriptional MerR regulator